MYLRKGYMIIVILLLFSMFACATGEVGKSLPVLPDHPVSARIADKWVKQVDAKQVCMTSIEFEGFPTQVKAVFPCELWEKISVDDVCFFDMPTLICGGATIWEA